MPRSPRLYAVLLAAVALRSPAQNIGATPGSQVQASLAQKEALRIHPGIYQAAGFGNTFLVTTPAGNVIIDTSLAAIAKHHVEILKAVNPWPRQVHHPDPRPC